MADIESKMYKQNDQTAPILNALISEVIYKLILKKWHPTTNQRTLKNIKQEDGLAHSIISSCKLLKNMGAAGFLSRKR